MLFWISQSRLILQPVSKKLVVPRDPILGIMQIILLKQEFIMMHISEELHLNNFWSQVPEYLILVTEKNRCISWNSQLRNRTWVRRDLNRNKRNRVLKLKLPVPKEPRLAPLHRLVRKDKLAQQIELEFHGWEEVKHLRWNFIV